AGRLMDLNETDFDVCDAVERSSEILRPAAEAKALRLDLRRPAGPVWLHADVGRLRRIVTNLVDNAVKFTAAGGVVVAVRSSDAGVEITVSDTGCGIAEADVPRIFNEFFQARAAGDRAGGRGLGLATCKRFVEAMGGRLEVETAPGRGSTFTIR